MIKFNSKFTFSNFYDQDITCSVNYDGAKMHIKDSPNLKEGVLVFNDSLTVYFQTKEEVSVLIDMLVAMSANMEK